MPYNFFSIHQEDLIQLSKGKNYSLQAIFDYITCYLNERVTDEGRDYYSNYYLVNLPFDSFDEILSKLRLCGYSTFVDICLGKAETLRNLHAAEFSSVNLAEESYSSELTGVCLLLLCCYLAAVMG
jgi:hypothetical protein